jgi:ribosome-associated heat shock protein Hsp15
VCDPPGGESAGREKARLDKWLWAARLFKTRSLAAAAVTGGKVQVNGARSKPARIMRLGDEVRVRKGPYEFQLVVRGLSERRGSAAAAQALYEESAASQAARAAIAAELRDIPKPMPQWRGRPTKRDRRQLVRLRPERDPER